MDRCSLLKFHSVPFFFLSFFFLFLFFFPFPQNTKCPVLDSVIKVSTPMMLCWESGIELCSKTTCNTYFQLIVLSSPHLWLLPGIYSLDQVVKTCSHFLYLLIHYCLLDLEEGNLWYIQKYQERLFFKDCGVSFDLFRWCYHLIIVFKLQHDHNKEFTFYNSRCCCKKHHQQQDETMIFLPALYWNQQSCFSVHNECIYYKHILCEMHAFITSAN